MHAMHMRAVPLRGLWNDNSHTATNAYIAAYLSYMVYEYNIMDTTVTPEPSNQADFQAEFCEQAQRYGAQQCE